ncbi:hypothetical protein IJG22_01695 [Candidatus Saccharibacteria bacterium]|nr:hypothetical protein [Candidatus Saccharibacteria bacterium]
MVIQNHYYKTIVLSLGAILGVTAMVGGILASNRVLAEDDTSVVDQINITVPIACTISGTGQNSHNANINNGLYEDDIGSTTLHAFCNDNEGFAIYAAGYTGDEVGGTNSNKLVGTTASNNATIESGIATTAGNPDISNWAMKLAITQDSGDTTGTDAFTIDSAPNVALPSEAESGATQAPFSSYHVVPNEYTKVAHKNSGTDMTESTGGVKLTTTYAAYISKTQPADTYSGQVIYTLVHPSSAVAGKLNVNFDGNGLTFPNGKSTNLVAYEASKTETTSTVTKKSYTGSYNEEGSFASYGVPAGNKVVTIDGAESIHIAVTYGAPQNNGGPPSDLYIFPGNHPDYTNSNSADGLASCGSTSSVNGAFSSNGGPDTQVTMECDIASDSVTFYDYSANTNNTASMGYYAVITGQGTIASYEKTATSGTYQTPTIRTNQDVFLGWSTNPNANADAEEPLYTNEADFIANAPYTNIDNTVTMYAVWGKTFNAAYADANKSQLSGHYKMQDGTEELCKEIYVGATETLIDTRDNTTYMAGRLKDGKCWMLDNLALDPTNSTTAANMNAANTNATQEAINNLLNGGNTTTGWSNTAVANVTTNFTNNDSYIQPRINNASKDTLVTSYGPASTNGQAKVGIYYNYCAASASTYCYASGSGIDVPDTLMDAPEDICPANWRMPTSGDSGEYYTLAHKYGNDAANTDSLQYNLSTPLSGCYYSSSANYQGSNGDWWSSTYSSSSYMYYLGVNPTSVYPRYDVGVRSFGRPMRCLMAD